MTTTHKILRRHGVPKTHKAAITIRPGIGKVSHRAKTIAKILTPLIGTISLSHIDLSKD